MQLRTDARANRAHIIEAARAAFTARGLGAEMKEIADRAHVGVGTLYRHFPSREDLLLALIRDALDGAAATVALAENAADPIDGLRLLLAQTFVAASRHGWLVEAAMSGQLPLRCQDELRSEKRERALTGRFERMVGRCVVAGRLRADLNILAAAAMLDGAALPWNYRRFRGALSPEQAADTIVDLFLGGAAAPA